VSPVIRFRDIDEAIRIANGTAYGLSSAVCTNRLDYITRFVNELQVGTVNVREVPGYRLELTPFGGIKDSGLGYKEGVQEAMKSFTNLKTYSLPWRARQAARGRQALPVRHPPRLLCRPVGRLQTFAGTARRHFFTGPGRKLHPAAGRQRRRAPAHLGRPGQGRRPDHTTAGAFH
jgi:hypothetical protein